MYMYILTYTTNVLPEVFVPHTPCCTQLRAHTRQYNAPAKQ